MTTEKIAQRLVELCRQGKFEDAQKELYANDALSIEPKGAQLPGASSLKGIIENGRNFRAGLENIHSLVISDPIVNGNTFALSFSLDADFKGAGRNLFQEICSYKVKDGKIVLEEFIY